MRNYKRTGILVNPQDARKPIFGDFSDIDFESTQRRIAECKTQFEMMPNAIRNKFHNNPKEMVDFLAQPENEQESIKLGLRIDPKLSEPYMMLDKNKQPTGVMKHPGKTVKEHKYFKDGKPSDKFGNLLPPPVAPPVEGA